MRPLKFLLFITAITFLASCGSDSNTTKKEYKLNRPVDEVIEWELANFKTLNIMIDAAAEAQYTMMTMFYTSTNYDRKTLELVPVLVKSLPEKSTNDKGELLFTYEIRPEAKWDNGSPITAKDLEFSLKVLKNPKVDCQADRSEFTFIDNVILYNDNPKKYTIVFSHKYINSLRVSGDIPIVPQYLFDPNGLMNEFTIKELTYNADKLADNPKIIEFANLMNSEKYKTDKDILKGGGPYEIEEWIQGQKIVLKKKQNWWGDVLKGQNAYFDNFPTRIIHQIINDQSAAITAMKGENIDVIRSVKPKDFVDLQKNKAFLEKYNLYVVPIPAWSYLGINTKLSKFSDKKVRQALAHIANIDKMIQVAMYGFGERSVGPIRPDQKEFYNSDIKLYDYNVDEAKKLLAEAGWKDSNGDGNLDKSINGKHTELTINLDYPAGNEMRKTVCLLYQEDARNVGIKVEVRAIEPTLFRKNEQTHNFEMAYGSWTADLKIGSLKELFSTTMANGGANYESFGTPESDAILDSIEVNDETNKLVPLFKKLQEIIHDESAQIFLYVPKERIAVHKRFGSVTTNPYRPGYWVPNFKLDESTQ